MEKEWFKTWFTSPYYYLLHTHQQEQRILTFIDRLIENLHPEANVTMLDTACGRGQYAKYLAGKGFDVTGLDLSADAIEAAKEKEQANLHFFEQDLRLPYAINLFDYCFNFSNLFGYFRTQRENENALRTIVQSLKQGGKLVIDYFSIPYEETHFLEQQETNIEDVYFNTSSKQDENFLYKTIEVKHGSSIANFTEQFRKYNLDAFTVMLQKQGVQVKDVFGNYELATYNEAQSPRMIIIAEKQ